jgi:hypothetical protein
VFEVPCPTCKAAGIVQYGVPPVSQHDMRPKPKRFWQRQEPKESRLYCIGGNARQVKADTFAQHVTR